MPPRGPGTAPFSRRRLRSRVGLDHLQVERGDTGGAELASHASALEHPCRCGAGPYRARRPVVLVVAMAGALAVKVVALHAAGEALALAHGGDVDLVPGRQQADGQLLADLVLGRVRHPQLHQRPSRVDTVARSGVVAGLRLVKGAGLAGPEGHLHRGVPVPIRGLELHDAHRRDPDDGDRDGAVLVVPDLGHADFLADDRFGWHSWLFLGGSWAGADRPALEESVA